MWICAAREKTEERPGLKRLLKDKFLCHTYAAAMDARSERLSEQGAERPEIVIEAPLAGSYTTRTGDTRNHGQALP